MPVIEMFAHSKTINHKQLPNCLSVCPICELLWGQQMVNRKRMAEKTLMKEVVTQEGETGREGGGGEKR